MTTTAGAPSSRAARATPCAWLPDEYVMTPRASASAGSEAIATYAPRILNAPIGWSDSAFRKRRSSGGPNGDQRRAGRDAAQAFGRRPDVVDA